MALAMKVISQVAQQRKTLEEAVTTALELAAGKSDGAEVSVSKTTGIGVSTRYGEVENVGIQQRWGIRHHGLPSEPQGQCLLHRS